MLLKILLVFFISLSVYAKEITLASLYNSFSMSKDEAKKASIIWKKEMKKEYPKYDFNVILYKDAKKILKDYIDKKIQVIIADEQFYFRNKKELENLSNYIYILSNNEKVFHQFYLLKNKKSDLKNTKNLKAIFRYYPSLNWLKSLNLDIKDIKRVENEKKLIFDVFFNKNSISVVKKELYDSMIELNPQITKRIEVIKKSKTIFIDALGFMRSDDDKINRIFNASTKRINSSNSNFEVNQYIQLQKLFLLKDKELKPLYDFYKNNNFIKAKNE